MNVDLVKQRGVWFTPPASKKLAGMAGFGTKRPDAEYLGSLVTGFVLALLLAYIGGNILRAKKRLKWMGHGTGA